MKKVKTAKRVECHKRVPYFEHLQYMNLRKNYSKVIQHILGKDYYNMACDVYTCDDFCADDLIRKYDELENAKNRWISACGALVGVLIVLLVYLIF